MSVVRALLVSWVVLPAFAAPKAVVLGVWGVVPGAPHEEMTSAWRQAAKGVKAYEWLPVDESIEGLKGRPGCAQLGPACRGRIAKELGADILFFARHFFWGVAFEQIEVATGSQLRSAKVPMAETGEALVANFSETGVVFVKKSAPEPEAGAAPVAKPAPAQPPTETAREEPTPIPPKPAVKATAAQKAVFLGVWGVVPGAPHAEMTNSLREGARDVKGYHWLPLDEPVEELQKLPGCAEMGPACRGRISKGTGADILFFGRHFFWGTAFEQVEVKTGSQMRKAKIPMAETGEALIARCTEAGIAFIREGAPEPEAGVEPVAAPGPGVEAPAKDKTAAAEPRPAAEARPAAEPESVAAAEPAAARAEKAAQIQDPEISGKPEPAAGATTADAKIELEAGPSIWERLRLRTWLAAGGTGALLVSGLVFGVMARNAENDLNAPSRGCYTDTQLTRCLELERDAENRALVANVLLITGGVAAVGTGTLVYLDLSRDRAGATLAMNF